MTKLAFLGLGIMGSRMAKNLLNSHKDLTVYNRTLSATDTLTTQGAKVAKTPAECVTQSDVVFTMLSTPEAIRQVATGSEGFVKQMKKNAIWVDASTVNPSFSQEMSSYAKAHGIRFLECPVSGSKAPAEKAELTFFVGGEIQTLDEVKPLLECMGKKIIYTGEVGKGASIKILINYMLAQSMLAFAESVHLGEAMGLSKEFLLDLLPKLPVAAPFLQAKADKIKNNNYEADFPLEWMQKDLHLLTLSAYEQKVPLLMGNLAKELYMKAVDQDLGRSDFSAIIEALKAK